MAAASDSSRGRAPLSDYKFDGSNWEDLTRLATLAKLHRASGTEVDSDATQSTWVARQFTGPALDLVTNLLAVEPKVLDDFTAFIARVREHFGISDGLVVAHQRNQLDALKWRRDLPTFFAEFERLSHACGMGGENSGKITLLVAKIPEKYRSILARQVPPPGSYSDHRQRLLLLWAQEPTAPGVSTDRASTKPKCGRCGKQGHTASDCRAPST